MRTLVVTDSAGRVYRVPPSGATLLVSDPEIKQEVVPIHPIFDAAFIWLYTLIIFLIGTMVS